MSTLDLPLRTIRVYGTLAKELKRREFKAAVRSPIDAINFLLVNFPRIKNYIKPRAFQIIVGNTAIAEHQLSTPLEATIEIRIIPAICGAGGSIGSILLGTALIAASIIFPFTAPYLLPLGIGLVLTGVAQLLIPVVTDDPERDDPAKSYNFSGVQQTSREGVSVPVVYGDIITGSVVISAGFEEFDDEIDIDFSSDSPAPLTGTPFPANVPVTNCEEYLCIEADHQYIWDIEFCFDYDYTDDTTFGCTTVDQGYCQSPGGEFNAPNQTVKGRAYPRFWKYWPESPLYKRAITNEGTLVNCACTEVRNGQVVVLPKWVREDNRLDHGQYIIATCYEEELTYQGDVVIQSLQLPFDLCYLHPSGDPEISPDSYFRSTISWSVVGARIIDQYGNSYEVDPAGFPHTGFLDNLP